MPSTPAFVVALSRAVVTLTVLPPSPLLAADDLPGSELLTSRERVEYRQSLRGMLSAGQRDQIRHRYEALIRQRAKEQSVTLPGQPQDSPGQGPDSQGQGPDSQGADSVGSAQ